MSKRKSNLRNLRKARMSADNMQSCTTEAKRSTLSPNLRILTLMSVALVLLVTVSIISISFFTHNKTNTGALEANIQKNSNSANGSIFSSTTRGKESVASFDLTKSDNTETETKTEDEPVKVTLDPAVAPLPFENLLAFGDDHDALATIQERLMALSYMDNDEPTTHFGPITREAITAFQRRNNLELTGDIDETTYRLLMSDNALTYMICLDDNGDDVAAVQDRLYQMGYMSIKPTGHFGDVTKKAVELFQKNNNLVVDGKVATETKELLYSGDAVPNFWAKGDYSEIIIPYQERLIKLAYLTGEADGTNGSATIAAVKKFQERNGLIADGYLGPDTIAVLMDVSAIANSISIGSVGEDVAKVQQRLYKYGYVKKSSVTGYFGSTTDYAVRAFQKRNNLNVDGSVGAYTMKLLLSDDAKKPSSSYRYYSESSNNSSTNNGGNNNSGNNGGNNGGNNNGGNNNGGNNNGGNNGGTPSISRLVEAAKSRLGCRYVTGGKGPNKFDCSGLVYWCLNQAGVKQSYLTSRDWRSVTKYKRISSLDSLRAGDIIVFYGHVGIIVSNSDMIDASSTAGQVVRRDFHGSWSRRNFICGYRIFD